MNVAETEPTEPQRERLPNRRLQITEPVSHGKMRFLLTVGFDRAGRAREAFVARNPDIDAELSSFKSGSELEHILDDSCVLLSLALQAGHAIADVTQRLGGRVAPGEPLDDGNTRDISLLRLLAEHVARIEADSAGAVIEGYRWAHGERPPLPIGSGADAAL